MLLGRRRHRAAAPVRGGRAQRARQRAVAHRDPGPRGQHPLCRGFPGSGVAPARHGRVHQRQHRRGEGPVTVSDNTSATAADVLPALEEVYTRIKRISRELRPGDRIVADLGIDSLATVELLLSLEDRFGISLVEDPRAADVETVGDLVELITALRG
ncbi:acyl carrier protein [Saccharothrix syringae]|uniref:Acyl carrier protein n=1 Tax=Saccharothrix syringae TaxID=103733 RepID=A0A5Q0H3R1_SACSY|nr:acyl carrier protein [Saccharothrix syringae]